MATDSAKIVTVIIETPYGEITVDLDAGAAPGTTANFLAHLDAGSYNGGFFHRVVTPENQPNDTIRIEVTQGGVDASYPREGGTPILLERTTVTGLRHVDGAISMARSTPDSAVSDFFICIGDQPELDFGGKRNPDGQGFAAFGKVSSGMETVRTIQQAPHEAQKLTPPVPITRIRRAAGGLA